MLKTKKSNARVAKIQEGLRRIYGKPQRIPLNFGVSINRQFRAKFARTAQYYLFAGGGVQLSDAPTDFALSLSQCREAEMPSEAIAKLLSLPTTMPGIPSVWYKCLCLSSLSYEARIARGDYVDIKLVERVLGNPRFWIRLAICDDLDLNVSKRRLNVLDSLAAHLAIEDNLHDEVLEGVLPSLTYIQAVTQFTDTIQSYSREYYAVNLALMQAIAGEYWSLAKTAATHGLSELGLSKTVTRTLIPSDWEKNLQVFIARHTLGKDGELLRPNSIARLVDGLDPHDPMCSSHVHQRLTAFKRDLFVFEEQSGSGARRLADFVDWRIDEYGLYDDDAVICEAVLPLLELSLTEMIFEFSY